MRRRREGSRGRGREPVGVILAGGDGQRIGGSKAIVNLQGRPLIAYPLEALRGALRTVTVVAKVGTALPNLPGVTVWIEPDEPHHPLVGIVHALGMAEGRPVLVCAVDLPFVSSTLIERIARTDPGLAPAVLASSGGLTQPLLGCYQPRALELLAAGGSVVDPSKPMRELAAEIGALTCEVTDAVELFNVNSPDDLLQAAGMLDRRGAPSRT